MAPSRAPPSPSVIGVKRLVRPLTVVLGVLIALGGGAIVVVRASAAHSPAKVSAVTHGSTSAQLPGTGSTGPGNDAATAFATGSGVTTTTVRPSVPTSASAPPASPPTTTFSSTLDAAVAGTNSCVLVEDGNGQTLYQHRADIPLIPASTQKLLVGEAALVTLGPDYRFTTRVMASSAPVNGKVAALWLVGSGDPLLATPEFIAYNAGRARVAGYPWTPLANLASSVAAAGITQVPGGVRGDDSFEDKLRFLPVWPALYQQQQQIGLLSALSVNEGVQFTPPTLTLAQDPPNYAASELARLLQLRQVPVGSQPDQTVPAGAVVLASVQSAPLSQIVEAMIRASDNWIAELLTRAIDKASGGSGTTAGGVAVVLRNAAQFGIPLTGVHMDDGSGLSRTDRATCRELLAALALGNQAPFSPTLTGLAVAGQTGTMAARYRGTPEAGRLRAKTGSLDGVGAMVGLITVTTPLRFAFIENDATSETVLIQKQDALVAALATFHG